MRRRVLIVLGLVLALLSVSAVALAQTAGDAVTAPSFDLAWVSGLVGFFLPLVVSFVKRNHWSTGAKHATALVASAIAAVITTGFDAGWVFHSVGEFLQLAVFSVVDIYVVASVTYQHFFDDTKIEVGLANVGSPTPKAPPVS